MDNELYYMCAYCFQMNHTTADTGGASLQRYVEDCQTCCQPNVLSVYFNEQEETWAADSERES